MATRAQSAHLKKAFLEDFRIHGNVTTACERTGAERRTIYKWRESDSQFREKYDEAEVEATEHLEAEAWRRAVEGDTVETPIIYKGDVVDTIVETKRSDTLLIFLLKARAPEKYRDVLSVRGEYRANVNVKHEHSLSADPDRLANVLAILIESGALPAGSGPVIDAEAHEVHPAHPNGKTTGILTP